MVFREEVRGMHVSRVYPFVVAFRETFPFDKVLEFSRLTVTPMAYDSFDFLFFFAVDQIRRWPGEIGSVIAGFSIWCQQRCMEDVMNPPIVREKQAIGDRGDNFGDREWSIAFRI